MFTKESLPDGGQVRFLDLAPFEYKVPEVSVKDKDGNELNPALVGKEVHSKFECTAMLGSVVSVDLIEEGVPVKRMQLHMPRSLLNKINAIAKGEQ